jgi:deoxyribonucleoside regulator|nr:sugar-binding transcriptional regulator [uncultured Anaerostipes sp.]
MDMQRRTMTLISKLYYEENMTQQQIAKQTGLSRMKVSRILQKAKEEEVVRIIIDYSGVYPELEQDVKKKYGLKDVVVIDTSIGNSSKEQVASAAAYYLERHLEGGVTVAVGWGSTMRLIPDYVQKMNHPDLLFSPIIGGHGQSELDMHATTIASTLAKKAGGRSLSLIAPALVNSKEEKEFLINDEQVKKVIEKTSQAEYAVFSLGNPLAKDSSISKSGYISEQDLKQLGKEDAICDVVSVVFLDKDSEICCENITERCIGITEKQLKQIPNKICVVESEEKYASVKSALEAGYIDILITDQNTAQYLSK